MLLHIMSFTGDISRHHSPTTQSYPSSLAFSGVGLFGFCNSGLEADALHFGSVSECWGTATAGALFFAAAAADLVVGCVDSRGGGEFAGGGDVVGGECVWADFGEDGG